jgi:hopene-associated glycosyltransferase HpnB
LVDDRSTDGTAEAARAAAGGDGRLTIIQAPPLEPGWTGKLSAVNAGLGHALRAHPEARFVLLTDADILHERSALRRLVAKAEAERRDLVSLMVKLHCEGPWERMLIPAFVFFFQKLYPFPRVNDPSVRMAGAAGGCMLARRTALERIGGLGAIKGELIDDCALARAIKANGSIWLGLAEASMSLRSYDGLGGIWRMVARTAFTQLRFSIFLLAGTALGMAVLYAAPPIAAVVGLLSACWTMVALGAAGWLLMAALYRPTQRLYGRPAWESALLPVAALLYLLMTLSSAVAHWRGRGGAWKGRTYAKPR